MLAHGDDIVDRDGVKGGRRVAANVQDGRVAGVVAGQEQAQGRAAAAIAGEFHEGQVVAMGEDADPTCWDAGAAGGAGGTVGNGAEAIAGMHRT